MIKKSMTIRGHRTSISLEAPFLGTIGKHCRLAEAIGQRAGGGNRRPTNKSLDIRRRNRRIVQHDQGIFAATRLTKSVKQD